MLDILEYSFDSLSRLDFKRYLVDDIMTKVDRATMAYTLEYQYLTIELPTNLNLFCTKELIDRPKRGFKTLV